MIKGTRFGIVCSLLLLGLVAFFGIGAEARRPQKPWSVAIQTFGRVDAVLIGLARQAIEESFNVRRVIELPPEELPVGAFYEPGKRYRAEKILAFLDDLILDTPTKIVGLICVDISTTKDHYEDWGIFGMCPLSAASPVLCPPFVSAKGMLTKRSSTAGSRRSSSTSWDTPLGSLIAQPPSASWATRKAGSRPSTATSAAFAKNAENGWGT